MSKQQTVSATRRLTGCAETPYIRPAWSWYFMLKIMSNLPTGSR
jgi:hypothetical protein